MTHLRLLISVVGLSGLAALAQVPDRITFNARMTDTAGAPVTGSHSVFVALFANETGGSSVWSETWPTLSFTTDGLAFVELGTNVPLTPAVFTGTKLYLELTIDGTVMSPRLGVVSVPYAIRAGEASTLGGVPASGFAPVSHTHNYLPVGTSLSCPGTQKVSALSASGDVTCTDDVSMTFAGTGTSSNAARSDHNHTGVYLPISATGITCSGTSKVTGITATGTVTCGPDVDTDTDTNTTYSAGAGLTLTGTQFALNFTVAGGTNGVTPIPARFDHRHVQVCPSGFGTVAIPGQTGVFCIRQTGGTAVTWYAAARGCVGASGSHLCKHEEILALRVGSPNTLLPADLWLGDRVADDWALYINSAINSGSPDNFEGESNITTDTHNGYLCCLTLD